MVFKQLAIIELKLENREFEEELIKHLKEKGCSVSKLLNPRRLEVFKIEN